MNGQMTETPPEFTLGTQTGYQSREKDGHKFLQSPLPSAPPPESRFWRNRQIRACSPQDSGGGAEGGPFTGARWRYRGENGGDFLSFGHSNDLGVSKAPCLRGASCCPWPETRKPSFWPGCQATHPSTRSPTTHSLAHTHAHLLRHSLNAMA